MTIKQMKNLKVNLPPYFILKNGRKNENKFNLSYHFDDNNEHTINIWFDKDCEMWKGKGISLGTYNNEIKNEKDKNNLILNNVDITPKQLQTEISKIRF